MQVLKKHVASEEHTERGAGRRGRPGTAVDEDNRVLVFVGDSDVTPPTPTELAPTTPPVDDHTPPPLSYTPKYLTEKILTSRSALEGEQKQVTVLFADIKDSTELITDLGPEDAQKLLDPAIHIMMDAVHRFEGTVNQMITRQLG